MAKKTKYLKTVNSHHLYQLETPINGLHNIIACKNNVVLKSFPSVEEAEAYSNVDSPELVASLDGYLAEEEAEQHPPTFWQQIWGAVKGLKK